MSFVAYANQPPTPEEGTLANDGWFPDFVVANVREVCRFDGSVTVERLKEAMLDAIASVNGELQHYADEQQARWGYACLADVPAPQIRGESIQVTRYRRAVHATLQADLNEEYRNLDTMPAGLGKEARVLESMQVKVGTHLRNKRWAISDLLGISRTTIELI